MQKKWWVAAMAATVVSFAACGGDDDVQPLSGTLKKADLDAIVARQSGTPPEGFESFLDQVAKDRPELHQLVQRYKDRSKVALAGDDLLNVSRLLGLHNRLLNQGPVIDAMARMVALPTVRGSVPPYEDPNIIALGELVGKMAGDFGLQYRNVDNRIFEVKLPGSGPDEFGILTHGDVVPVVAAEWVLDDGTQLDPFKQTRVGDLLYGRGTIDDKGSIATVLYAMRAVKDSGLPLSRTIRLMIETTEESGGEGMNYYKQKTTLPEYNIVLDSKYPAVVAEKGSGSLRAQFAEAVVGTPAADAIIITAMAGAASASAIPETATARLQSADPAALAAQLEAAAPGFINQYEG